MIKWINHGDIYLLINPVKLGVLTIQNQDDINSLFSTMALIGRIFYKFTHLSFFWA
jgi:hypothetical protein